MRFFIFGPDFFERNVWLLAYSLKNSLQNWLKNLIMIFSRSCVILAANQAFWCKMQHITPKWPLHGSGRASIRENQNTVSKLLFLENFSNYRIVITNFSQENCGQR